MYMLKKKEKRDLHVKNVKKGYISIIDNYIKLLKENGMKIDNIEINLNEMGQIDLKIKGKEM